MLQLYLIIDHLHIVVLYLSGLLSLLSIDVGGSVCIRGEGAEVCQTSKRPSARSEMMSESSQSLDDQSGRPRRSGHHGLVVGVRPSGGLSEHPSWVNTRTPTRPNSFPGPSHEVPSPTDQKYKLFT
jgi:hypothetical protein